MTDPGGTHGGSYDDTTSPMLADPRLAASAVQDPQAAQRTIVLCPDCSTQWNVQLYDACPVCAFRLAERARLIEHVDRSRVGEPTKVLDGAHQLRTDVAQLDQRREVEARVGIDYLDQLQARRSTLVREAAPLRAFKDVWEARRKAHRGLVLVLQQQERKARGEKEPAANIAELLASADPRYVEFLNAAEERFARLSILDDEITKVTEIINRGQRLADFVSHEPRG